MEIITANRLFNFFVGNKHRHILWTDSGWISSPFPISINLILKHMRYDIAIGSYPIYENGDGRNYCKWLCIDVDAHTDEDRMLYLEDLINNIYIELLSDEGIPQDSMLLEFSGGGYHLWIFLEEKTTLEMASKFAYVIKERLKEYDFGGYVELYPKQFTTEHLEKGLGNAVRLPCGKNLGKGVESQIIRGNIEDIIQFNTDKYVDIEVPEEDLGEYLEPRVNAEVFPPMDVDEELAFWLEFPLKPCIKMIITGQTRCHGAPHAHKIRMATVHECNHYKMPIDVIVKAFKNQPDYVEEKTRKQVLSVLRTSRRVDSRYGCDKIRAMGYCHKETLGCDYVWQTT